MFFEKIFLKSIKYNNFNKNIVVIIRVYYLLIQKLDLKIL